MTRIDEKKLAQSGNTNTTPGDASAACRDGFQLMHPTPGVVDFFAIYEQAINGDDEATSSLSESALSEHPSAQYYLAYLHFMNGKYDAAESWFRKAAAHGHENARLCFAGLLLLKAQESSDDAVSILDEAVPILTALVLDGHHDAIEPLGIIRDEFGINTSSPRKVLQ